MGLSLLPCCTQQTAEVQSGCINWETESFLKEMSILNIRHSIYIFSAILDGPSNKKSVNYLHVTQFVACAEKEVLYELQVHFFFLEKNLQFFLGASGGY